MRETTDLFKLYRQPKLEKPALIVGFSDDVGRLGPKVIDYLNANIEAESFCEIEPTSFFALGGITVEDSIARFPDNRFFYNEERNIVTFKGSEPLFERYEFLQAVLDVAEHYCGITKIYTVSGITSLAAHTKPRIILAVCNQLEFQDKFKDCGLDNMNWEGVPALNTYLLWVARRRNIPGISLWPGVPFYLRSVDDPKAQKSVLEFFDRQFELGIDFSDINGEEEKQNRKLARLRADAPEVDKSIQRLETNFPLSQEEGELLDKQVEDFLKSEQ